MEIKTFVDFEGAIAWATEYWRGFILEIRGKINEQGKLIGLNISVPCNGKETIGMLRRRHPKWWTSRKPL